MGNTSVQAYIALMAFIPEGAKWYLAELVQELRVAGHPRNVIWRNLTLVRADSPEDAYQEALSLGRAGDTEYDNPQGNRVEVRFRGLSSLDVIHDELENGAELLFTSEAGVSEERLASFLKPKESLGVFSPIRPIDGPDVAAGYIVGMAVRMIADPHNDE